MLASGEETVAWGSIHTLVFIHQIPFEFCTLFMYLKKLIPSVNLQEPTIQSAHGWFVALLYIQDKVHTSLTPSIQSFSAVWFWPAFFPTMSIFMPCIQLHFLEYFFAFSYFGASGMLFLSPICLLRPSSNTTNELLLFPNILYNILGQVVKHKSSEHWTQEANYLGFNSIH